MKKYFYPLLVFTAGALWGFSGLFVRNLTNLNVSTFNIVFFRVLISAIVICLFFLIFDRKAYKVKFKDLWCFLGTGVLGMLLTGITYFTTMQKASLSTACILMYTAPVFVILLSAILFKEKVTVSKGIGLVLTMVGTVLCSYEKGGFSISFSAFLVGICSGLSYGLYSIFTRFAYNKGYTSETIILYGFIFSFLGSLAFADYSNLVEVVSLGTSYILPAILLAVVSTVAPYALFTMGLKKTENGKASIISSIEIVSSLVVGTVFFKEYPNFIKVIGIVLVFVAIVIINIKYNKKENLIK